MNQSIIGYGEVLLRLSPSGHGDLIEQTATLNMDFAGAEANIIADLAILGHTTAFISALPNNPVGRAANQFLQKFGTQTAPIVWDAGRVGTYYIEHGTAIRGTRVTYDRANSSVATTILSEETWAAIFSQATYFILTGITPALSQVCRDNIQRALTVAKANKVKVVFDLNYRRTLWSQQAARASFEEILPYVDILIANRGAAFDVFDIQTVPSKDYASLERATLQAATDLSNLGNFEHIAMTIRLQNNADDNILGGMIQSNNRQHFSQPIPTKIIDRLGGGDAFTAALLHGLIKNWSAEKNVNFATAAFATTQTLKGDINYCTEEELLSIASGNLQGYVKR